MKTRIECINSKNEKFMAHQISNDGNIIKFKCGACMVGDIFLVSGHAIKKCKACGAKIKVS